MGIPLYNITRELVYAILSSLPPCPPYSLLYLCLTPVKMPSRDLWAGLGVFLFAVLHILLSLFCFAGEKYPSTKDPLCLEYLCKTVPESWVSSIPWSQNSLRKSGFFVNNVLRKTLPLYFRALEDHHTCSAIHAKFGSGLTCNERNVRYTF